MRFSLVLFSALLFFSLLLVPAYGEENTVTDELRGRCLKILRTTMLEEEEWVKVHAAEHLLALRYPEGVEEEFNKELELHGDTPKYRIGIWRTLSKAAKNEVEREKWIRLIVDAFADLDGEDRLHAAETLAKLYYVAGDTEIPLLKQEAESEDTVFAAFVLCMLVHTGEQAYETNLAALLEAADARTRQCAAYAMRFIDSVSPTTYEALVQAVEKETPGTLAKPYLNGAALVHANSKESAKSLKEQQIAFLESDVKSDKYETISVLAIRGNGSDLPALTALLDDPEADIRQGAAYAILRIERRLAHPLHLLDWAAIIGYAALLIGVGLYYSRRTKTTEDYNLGGRNMRPLLVGFSMFATLLSTLTYLAIPGEMMKHGPMILAQYAAYPLVFVVIAFVLIPVIMKQKVTSAYEILENKLGLSVRMLGSIFFLSLRFLWMALIVYASCSKILIPVLQLDESMTPVLCAIMGAITVVYTSMGGLRAVVITDVIQTAILFGGAFLTLGLITWHMGGVSAWWPTQWSADWDPIQIMYNPNARITVMGVMTSYFVWHICTAGSDQVTIQRYLATRNAASARRVLLTSSCTDVTVGVFLGILGMALFAYFQKNPYMLPDNYQSLQNADTLFPRFIVMGLPAGIGGLVIAGLLAAAMSSLSSGVNSSSVVITVDFLNRFSKKKRDETASVNQAKWVSVLVGVAVILLSILTGMVGGTLLEVVYKVVNLLVAPLFVLFFMALFIPWANAPGDYYCRLVQPCYGCRHCLWWLVRA